MSHYDALADDQKIRLASEAVSLNTPIPPAIRTWLEDNSLLYKVQNPKGR